MNYGRESILSFQLLNGDEIANTDIVMSFVRRFILNSELVKENLQRATDLQKIYYDEKHRDVQFTTGSGAVVHA